jgi:putative inorganic carbon (hco3(-)) transporter
MKTMHGDGLNEPAAPFWERWRVPLLALVLAVVCGAYGFVITRELPLPLIVGLPLAAVVTLAGLRRPELLTVILLGATWGYISETLIKFHGVPSVAKSLVVVLVALVLHRRFIDRRGGLVTHPLLWWTLSYTLIVAAGLWYARDVEHTWLVLVDVAKELLLLFVVVNTLTNARWVERGVWAMLLVGAVLGTMTLYQELTRNYDNTLGGFARSSVGAIADGVSNRPRAGGPTSEPNAFGQQMLVLVPVGLWAALHARTLGARMLGGYAAFACLGGAALSFSRGTYLAFMVMAVLMLLHVRLNPRYLLILPLLLYAVTLAPPELRARFTSLGTLLPGGERLVGERDASVERREIEMLMAVYMFADHPLVGVGADNYRDYFSDYVAAFGSDIDTDERNAHSYYLEIAAEHGLVGIIAIGGIMLITVTSLRRAGRQFKALGDHRMAELTSALVIGFAGYAVTATFLHGDYTRFFWLQVCIAAATSVVAARAYAAAFPQPAAPAAGDQLPAPTPA